MIELYKFISGKYDPRCSLKKINLRSSTIGLPRVLEYSRLFDSKNYSSNFLLLEYSLNSTSGCKFPLPVSIFANEITDLLPFVQIWTLRFVPLLVSTSNFYHYNTNNNLLAAALSSTRSTCETRGNICKLAPV